MHSTREPFIAVTHILNDYGFVPGIDVDDWCQPPLTHDGYMHRSTKPPRSSPPSSLLYSRCYSSVDCTLKIKVSRRFLQNVSTYEWSKISFHATFGILFSCSMTCTLNDSWVFLGLCASDARQPPPPRDSFTRRLTKPPRSYPPSLLMYSRGYPSADCPA